MTYRKKLIEVSLPLEAINDASAYDKMPGIGPHPKGIHHWWAPLPLPSARAILFASLVDDPSADPRFSEESESKQNQERERLFTIMRAMLQKKIHEHPQVFEDARIEISRSCNGHLPNVLVPFNGGGSIPLESLRLGLPTQGSDLNPIAVLKTKALIEILPRFANAAPVRPDTNSLARQDWNRASGIAADVRYYSQWIFGELYQRHGHIYPRVALPKSHGGGDATVAAWIWARTVRCANPACAAKMPLVSSFSLATKKGRQAWIEPIIDRNMRSVSFEVHTKEGKVPDPPKLGRGAAFRCLVCGQVADDKHVKNEGLAGRMGMQLMAIAVEGRRGKYYVSPSEDHVSAARVVLPTDAPTHPLADDPRNIWCVGYGLDTIDKLFTPRQLTALSVLSSMVNEARVKVKQDALAAGMPDDNIPLRDGGTGATAYSDAVATFLGFAIDRCADFNNSLCRWSPGNEKVMNLFGRQVIPMTWDFAEANILSESVGSWSTCSDYVADCIEVALLGAEVPGEVRQQDAPTAAENMTDLLVSTDPPYYDNISYADLSDFFYVWLRRSIGSIYPDIFSTLLVPKGPELIASPQRFGGNKEQAK